MVGSVTSISRRSLPRRNLIRAAMGASASPIGGVAVGGDQQRDMIVPGGVGDAEADHDLIQERRIRQRDTLAGEIAADMKDELIGSGKKRSAFQQGMIAAPIGIGCQRQERATGNSGARWVEPVQLDVDALRRPASGGIED